MEVAEFITRVVVGCTESGVHVERLSICLDDRGHVTNESGNRLTVWHAKPPKEAKVVVQADAD